jgi:hypothetical protein
MEQLFESLNIDINEETKAKLAEAFDKAVMAKTVELMEEHVETRVAEEVEKLEEEYQEKVEDLENSLDGYLQSVVEEFIEENQPVYEAQVNEEKSIALLEMFDNMIKIAGIKMLDINEAHEQYHEENDDILGKKLAKLEEKYDDMAEKLVEARAEADKYLKAGVIMEMKQGLSMLEAEKFEKLAEMVTFTRDESFVDALETIKESIIDQRSDEDKGVNESIVTLPEDAYAPKKVDTKKALDFSQYV